MNVISRELGETKSPGGRSGRLVLDCLALDDPTSGRRLARVHFAARFSPDQIDSAKKPGLSESRSIGGGLVITFERPKSGPLIVALHQGKPLEITPTISETELFAGLNCAVAVRNGKLWTTCANGWRGTANITGLRAKSRVMRPCLTAL